MPHVGTELPQELTGRLRPAALALPDTDWHLPELYHFLPGIGATCLRARYSRYVIDLNRRSDGASLYPGQSVTELCPTTLFSGEPLYRPGQVPEDAEVAERTEHYWAPYHRALAAEIDRLRRRHGYALLWDAHSIRGEVPRFFEGRLPDLSIGTAGGGSCSPALTTALVTVMKAQRDYSWVVDGRFQGGAITRGYGDPARGVHALQLELAQRCYMDEESPHRLDERLAGRLRPLLRAALESLLELRPPFP